MPNKYTHFQDALQRDVQPTAPMPENGAGDGAVICSRCATANPVGSSACLACRSFLPANQAARRTGIYARQQPPDLTRQVETFVAGLISDQGGAECLTTIEQAYITKLGDIEVTIRLLTNDIAVNGLLTPGGRVRAVYDKLLSGLALFDRYAQRLEARQKPDDPLAPTFTLTLDRPHQS